MLEELPESLVCPYCNLQTWKFGKTIRNEFIYLGIEEKKIEKQYRNTDHIFYCEQCRIYITIVKESMECVKDAKENL